MKRTLPRAPLKALATATGTALLALSLAAPAMAERGDNYHNRNQWKHSDHGRWADACPPGLARKHNGCVPPGQWHKREARRDDHRHHEWRRGDRIHGYDYRYVRDYQRYHLRRPPQGERYVIVGNQILRVNSDTLAVIATAGLIGALLNN